MIVEEKSDKRIYLTIEKKKETSRGLTKLLKEE
jgi:hypothetical protein